MLGDNNAYSLLVTLLVLAILTSLVFHIFFKDNTDIGFSEIYFTSPNELPNDVNQNKNYNYTFTIKNLEGKPSTYSYNSKLELFNLYDATEGIYKCIGKQRKKVTLEWIEGNNTDSEVFLMGDSKNGSFMFSKSNDYGLIDWPYYNIKYKYRNILDVGSFTTSFHYQNTTKFSFTVYSDTSTIEFAYLEDGEVKIQRKKISNLKLDNNVLISVDDQIKYYINDELIFFKEFDNVTAGKVDFRMDDTYILIGRLSVYRDSAIVVTKSSLIRDYEIDNKNIIKKINSLRAQSEDDAYMIRKGINLTDVCKEDYCDNLRSYLNNPGDAQFVVNLKNIDGVNLISTLDTFNSGQFPSQAYLQNGSMDELFWENFNVRVNLQTFVEPHTILISFDDNFMMLFHNSNVFFITRSEDILTINHRSSPIKVGVNEIFLESKKDNVVFKINGLPLFNFKRNFDFRDVSLYTKNTFIALDNIVAVNKHKDCSALSTSQNCKRTYRFLSERKISRKKALSIISAPIFVSAGLGISPFLGVSDLFESQNFLINDSNVSLRPDLLQLVDYEIELDPALIKEDIPSEKYVFDGENARLINKNNYSFSFDFNVLEGVGILEVSFHKIGGQKISTIILNEPNNEASIFSNIDGTLFKDLAFVNITQEKSHKLDIIHESNTTSYYFGGKKFFEYENIDMSNGYYSISTFNTHFDIRDISLYERTIKRRTRYSIDNDPCRLRKIDEIELNRDSLFLDNEEDYTINKNFTINGTFDYGLVSVFLEPELSNQTEIHFWVVKDD